jgi:hypothetical protein
MADVAIGEEQPRRGVRLLGAADRLRETIGAPLPPQEQVDHERRLAALRAALDEPTFDAAWAEGRAMTLEEAVAEAMKETS